MADSYSDPEIYHQTSQTHKIAILCADKDTKRLQKWKTLLVKPFLDPHVFDTYTQTLVDEKYTGTGGRKGVEAFAHEKGTYDTIVYEYCPTLENVSFVKPIIKATIKALEHKLKPGGLFFCPEGALKGSHSLKDYLAANFTRIHPQVRKAAMFTKKRGLYINMLPLHGNHETNTT